MPTIEVDVKEYANAKDGSLLIKKNGKWTLTTFDELNKVNKELAENVDSIKNDVLSIKRYSKHFVEYAKSHFLVVFNYFKIKVLSGEIDVTDENLLKLDEDVLSDKVSVEEAIEKHPFIKETFEKVYLNQKEIKEFPEV